MIAAFLLASLFSGCLAAGTMLVLGHPWWIALAAYSATGAASFVVLAMGVYMTSLATFRMPAASRQASLSSIRVHSRRS